MKRLAIAAWAAFIIGMLFLLFLLVAKAILG